MSHSKLLKGNHKQEGLVSSPAVVAKALEWSRRKERRERRALFGGRKEAQNAPHDHESALLVLSLVTELAHNVGVLP